MKKIYISILFMSLLSTFYIFAIPKWVTNLEAEFPCELFIRAKGEGNSEFSAKNAALAELNAYFGESIETKSYAQIIKTQDNSFYSSTSSYKEDVTVSTSSKLFGIQYTEIYYDKKENKYSICAYINKAEFFKIISQKLFFYEKKLESAQEENNEFIKILILNDIISNQNEIQTLYNYSYLLDSQNAQKFDELMVSVNESKVMLLKLKQKNPISVSCVGDYSKQVEKIISEILTNKGFIISKNGNCKISTTCYANISGHNNFFSCNPIISVSVELENNSSNFVFSSEEFASLNKQTVIKRALYEIKMLLNENLIQNVIN